MANPGISELLTTTLSYRTKPIRDAITNNIPLLKRLSSKGNAEPYPGGATIIEPISYASNGTYTRYTGYENINITPQDVITGAEFQMKQAAMSVSMSGTEQLQNSGSPESIFNWLNARVTNAERSFQNSLDTDLWSLGTASGGKQIGGMQLLVSDDATGTVGGIVAGSNTFWQNQFYDFSVNSLAASASTIQHAMNTLWLSCSRNNEKPDLIFADNTYFTYYEESLQAIQRLTSAAKGEAGFGGYAYKDAEVVPGGGMSGACPSAHMYFLNTDFIHYRPHRDRNVEVIGEDRMSTNQDAFVRLIGWAGNMTVSNRRMQGVIVA